MEPSTPIIEPSITPMLILLGTLAFQVLFIIGLCLYRHDYGYELDDRGFILAGMIATGLCGIMTLVEGIFTVGFLISYLPFAIIIACCIKHVEVGCQAIIVRWGRVDHRTLKSGLYILVPWAKLITTDVRNQQILLDTNTLTSDCQKVRVFVSISYKPFLTTINKLYQQYGFDDKFVQTTLIPLASESITSVISECAAEDLVVNRQNVKTAMEQALTNVLASVYMEFIDLSITGIELSKDFQKVVEAKQIAVQQALVEKSEIEKRRWMIEQQVLESRAEIEKLNQKAKTIQENPQLLVLNFIEAWREGGSKVPTSVNVGSADASHIIAVLQSILDTVKKP